MVSDICGQERAGIHRMARTYGQGRELLATGISQWQFVPAVEIAT